MSDLDFEDGFEDGFEDENGNEGMSEYTLVEGLGNFDGLSGVEEHEGNILDVRQDDLSYPKVQVKVTDCSASESKFSGTDESDVNHTAVLKSTQGEKEVQILRITKPVITVPTILMPQKVRKKKLLILQISL